MVLDRYQRPITYLRISVTDRCNFRCVYCMPPEGVEWRSHSEIMTYDEILTVVKASVKLGIRKIRITGGEPLVRRDLPELIEAIANVPGVEDLSLTTNAFLLERYAADLKAAGLQRINVSMDTLDAAKFYRISRGGSLDVSWRGILAAEKVGLAPIKINTVVVRDFNTDELIDLARLSEHKPWHIRFIELMPVSNSQDWGDGFPMGRQRYVSVLEMEKILEPLKLVRYPEGEDGGPARVYRIPGGLGSVGFISPIGEHFCCTCNRLRLTADGNLRPCLLNNQEISIRDVLRRGEEVTSYLLQAIQMKPAGHTLAEEEIQDFSRKMVQVGG